MTENSQLWAFRERLAEAVKAVAEGNRSKFAEMMGAGENAKQIGQLWHTRGAIPPKYGRAMEALGLSIDYVNHGDGQLRTSAPPPSQSGGLDPSKLDQSIRFLEEQFRLWGKDFQASERVGLIAAVYDRLLASPSSNRIELSQWLADQVKEEKEDVRQGETGSSGGDDRQGNQRRASAA